MTKRSMVTFLTLVLLVVAAIFALVQMVRSI